MKTALSVLIMSLVLVGGVVNGQTSQRAKEGDEKKQATKAEVMKGVNLDVINLNPPDLNKGIPVMQALKKRRSVRELSDKRLTLQQLSELLWAANGVNREDGKRTAPAALNIQGVDIYVVLPEGVYLYEPVKNQLLPAAQGDYRKQAGMQDFVHVAPVNLVYVGDFQKLNQLPPFAKNVTSDEKLKWAYIAAGLQAENVNLYAASEGLGATVRMSVDKEGLGKTIKLRPEQTIIVAQTIGYPK
jgi:nitroreductase